MGDDATSKPSGAVHNASASADAIKPSASVIQGDSETFAVGPRDAPRTHIEPDAQPAVMVRPSLVDDLEMSEVPSSTLSRMQIAPAKPAARLALEPAFGNSNLTRRMSPPRGMSAVRAPDSAAEPVRRMSPPRGMSAARAPDSAAEPVRRMSPPRGIALEPLVKNVPGTPPLRSLSPPGGLPATRVAEASTLVSAPQTGAAEPPAEPLTAAVTPSQSPLQPEASAPEAAPDVTSVQSAHEPIPATLPSSSLQRVPTAIAVLPAAPDSEPDSAPDSLTARTAITVRPDPDATAPRAVVSGAEIRPTPRGAWVAALVTVAVVAIAVLFGLFYRAVTSLLIQ